MRADVIKHPKDWLHGGYVEIQNPPSRYTIINLPALTMLCGFKSIKSLQDAHWKWIEAALKENTNSREPFWSNSVAVGSNGFIEKIHEELGVLAHGRSCKPEGESFVLREPDATYDVTFGLKRLF